MSAAALLLALLSAPPDPLLDPSREVRERAITDLALRGPPTMELVAQLMDPDPRHVVGVAAALERRKDRAALPALARLADDVEGARGRAGAEALVSIAFSRDVPLETILAPDMARASARVEAAVEREVTDLLETLGARASADRPQEYRRLFAGGAWTERVLRRMLADGRRGPSRASVMTILLKLTDGSEASACLALLDDAEVAVRAAAAAALLSIGDAEALARVASLAEAEGTLEPALHFAVFHAIAQGGRAGPKGEALLDSAVRLRPADLALAAAVALRATDPVRAERALRARVKRHILSEGKSPGAGCEAALFHLGAGPLPDDLLSELRATGNPWLVAATERDTARAILLMEDLMAPEVLLGSLLRVRILQAILRRPDAPWAARVAFAGSVLRSDASLVRRQGLLPLANAPAEALTPIRDRLLLALDDPSEEVRVRAAALVGAAPQALRVLVQALYDGERALAPMAVAALRVARPDWPLPDPRAPIGVRRRAALDLRERLDAPPRDME